MKEIPTSKVEIKEDMQYFVVSAVVDMGGKIEMLAAGPDEESAREKIKENYHLTKKEMESVKTEKLSKEEFISRQKQIYAIRKSREEKDR